MRIQSVISEDGNFLSDFPAYRGLFTYDVGGDAFPELGNGVFLWQLEILRGTMRVTSSDPKSKVVSVTCQMKKRLIDLPSDACEAIQRVKGNYVIEQWSGEANCASESIRLDRIGEKVVETTIDFPNTPVLKRDILSGTYEFVRLKGGHMLKSVHRSWVEIAQLDVSEAIGFMLRAPAADPVCPMLVPEERDDLDAKLEEARVFLQGTVVRHPEETRHRVTYTLTITRVKDISTKDEQFYAEVTLIMWYRVSRDEVFKYVLDPDTWHPTWEPEPPQIRNATRLEELAVTVHDPRLTVRPNEKGEKEVCVQLKTEYCGCFRSELSLRGFPFDIQSLQVEFRLSREPGLEYKCESTKLQRWDLQEENSEWDVLDTITRVDGRRKAFAVVRVARIYFVYLMRIIGVNALIMILSLCIFIIEADGYPDRLGHTFTMILTAVAYSLVVADTLPTLGYLTWLDKYIFGTYFFLSLVVIEFAAIEVLAWDRINSLNLVLFNVIVLVIFQIYFYHSARVHIQRSGMMRAGKEWTENSSKIYPFTDVPASFLENARLPLSALMLSDSILRPSSRSKDSKMASSTESVAEEVVTPVLPYKNDAISAAESKTD